MAEMPPEGLDEFLASPIPSTEANREPAQVGSAPPGLDEFLAPEIQEEKYGGAGQQALAGLEGLGRGIAGPLAPLAEKSLGVDPEGILGRREANPVTSAAGEVAGLVGGHLAGAGLLGDAAKVASVATLGGALGKVGEAANIGAQAVGLGRMGSAVVRGAIENLAYQAQDEGTKLILGDPNQTVGTAVADMGLAALLGGAVGSVPALWNAAMGKQTGGILTAIADKVGGIEGIEPNAALDAFAKNGVTVAPELEGLVSKNPAVQEMARTLQQTDTSKAGRSLQESYKDMIKQAGDSLASSVGKSADEIAALPEVSKYAAGQEIGNSLAKEYETQMNPLARGFEEVKEKFKGTDLEPSVTDKATDAFISQGKIEKQLERAVKNAADAQASGDTDKFVKLSSKIEELKGSLQDITQRAAKPGTNDSIMDAISKRAIEEGWVTSPSSDIMKEISRVRRELPLQKTLKNLSDFISQVGHNTSKDPMNGPLRRAGGIMTSIMKDAEADVIASKLGRTEGEAAVEHFNALREGYRVQSALKEAIEDRLGVRGSPSSYAEAIREMARTDGEGVLRRLGGKNDADWLGFVNRHYPETAGAIRKFHVDSLLENAASKAKDGFNIDNSAFLKGVNSMPKELRDFVIPAEQQSNIKGISDALEAFKNPNYNYSNTARTMGSLLKDHFSSAVAAATALTGHGFGTSALAGVLTKVLGHDTPDAIRLALLKFLASDQKINSTGFKAAADYIKHTLRGENLLSKATSNIFKDTSKVLPDHLMPTEKQRQKLEKTADTMLMDPSALMKTSEQAGYYFPNHSTALSQTATRAAQFIKAMKPNTDPAHPLDPRRPVNAVEKAQYNRKLDIIQQPLVVLKHIADGTLTPSDVDTVKTIYPGFYQRSVQKLMDNLSGAVAKEAKIPYKTKLGLSLYVGMPLDSTMQPQSIVAAQLLPQVPPQQQAPAPSKIPSSLGKLPGMYNTPGQAAEKDRLKRANH